MRSGIKDEKSQEKLGQRLRRYRLKRGLSITDVAQQLGVSTSTYREWEFGRAIRGEPYMKLREVFEVTLEELLTGSRGDKTKAFNHMDVVEDHLKRLRGVMESLA